MAKQDKLITYSFLCEECDLPSHLPNDELEGKIYRAQEMLRAIFGDDFYQAFITAYKSNSFSSAESALYDPYVKQFVAWEAHANWITSANFKITRSGFRVHTEEHSTAASDAQMGPLIKQAKYQAEYYKNLLTDYLDKNSASYPLYAAKCGCKSDNFFHMSAVRNREPRPQPYGTGSYKCGNCCD